jgi:hypothetical protein
MPTASSTPNPGAKQGGAPTGAPSTNAPGSNKLRPYTNYPSAKEVTDFHRNADTNKQPESIHHTLGNSRNNASPGDHTHDGGSSAALWSQAGGDTVSGNLGVYKSLAIAVKSILNMLSKKGIADSTTMTGYYYETAVGGVTVNWSVAGTLSDITSTTYPVGRFSASPTVILTRVAGASFLGEGRVANQSAAGFDTRCQAAASVGVGGSALFAWAAFNQVAIP